MDELEQGAGVCQIKQGDWMEGRREKLTNRSFTGHEAPIGHSLCSPAAARENDEMR